MSQRWVAFHRLMEINGYLAEIRSNNEAMVDWDVTDWMNFQTTEKKGPSFFQLWFMICNFYCTLSFMHRLGSTIWICYSYSLCAQMKLNFQIFEILGHLIRSYTFLHVLTHPYIFLHNLTRFYLILTISTTILNCFSFPILK